MERFEQLRNLVVMAVADGMLAEDELSLLAERCVQLGLDEEELRASVSFALSDEAALKLPSDPAEQEALLSDLIRMMAADGQLAEAEKRLFALAAAKMNFDTDRVNQLIDRLAL
ncbi:TerB family tellurite resistance protein [Planctomycetaceae bacterium SH139]